MTTAAEATIDLSVEAGAWPPEAALKALAARVVSAVAATTPEFPGAGAISILFTDDAHIAALNARWREKPNPTNVLSFPAMPGMAMPGEPMPIGDIVLGFETVTKEAAGSDLTLTDHISHLLVHGLLHLLGYDHEEAGAADTMEALETEILATLGIADPYAGSEPELTLAGGNS